MTWPTIILAIILEAAAVLGFARFVGAAPRADPVNGAGVVAMALAHAAAAALAGIALARKTPGARSRAAGAIGAGLALLAPPFGVAAAVALLMTAASEISAAESRGGSPEQPSLAADPAAALAPADLERALGALRFGAPAERRAALARLERCGERTAAPALRHALRDPEPDIAALARRAIARVEEEIGREILSLREELRGAPTSPLPRAALADAHVEYARLGLPDRRVTSHYLELAVKEYARAIELTGERDPELFLSLGRVLISLERHAAALMFLERAAIARPADARPLVLAVEPLFRLGRFGDLVQRCRRALDLDVEDPGLRAAAEYWVHDREATRGDARLEGQEPLGHEAVRALGVSDGEPPFDRSGALATELEALLPGLASTDPERREDAFRHLLAYEGPAAIEALTRLVEQKGELVRIAFCRWLSRKGGPLAVPPLVAMLDAPEPTVRSEAAAALDRFDPRGLVDELSRALEEGSVFARVTAAHVLGASGTSAARPLAGALHDTRAEVRERAVLALMRLGDRRALRPLLRLTQDHRAEIRMASLLALAELGHPRAGRAIELASRDEDARVRLAAAFALAHAARPATAIRALAALLTADDEPLCRAEAAARLGAVGATAHAERAVEPLLRAAATDPSPEVRRSAFFALDALPEARVLSASRRSLACPDARVRHAAVLALARSCTGDASPATGARSGGEQSDSRERRASRRRHARIVGALADTLSDAEPCVRAVAAGSLAVRCGRSPEPFPEPALVALERALADADETVAAAAATTLGRVVSGEQLARLARTIVDPRHAEGRGGSSQAPGAGFHRRVEPGTVNPGAGKRPLAGEARGDGGLPRGRVGALVIRRETALGLIHEAAARLDLPEPLLARCLEDLKSDRANIRYLAALALGRSRRLDALEPLLDLAALDGVLANREAAACAAGELLEGDPDPLLGRLERLLAETLSPEERSGDREAAVVAEALACPQARALLAALGARKPVAGRVEGAVTRLLALAPALAMIGVGVADEPSWLDFFAAAAGALPPLVAHPRADIAAAALRTVARLAAGGRSFDDREPIRRALASPDAAVRSAAAEALSALRDRGAIESLVVHALKDVDPAARASAALAVATVLRPEGD